MGFSSQSAALKRRQEGHHQIIHTLPSDLRLEVFSVWLLVLNFLSGNCVSWVHSISAGDQRDLLLASIQVARG
ncbi:hypothetical protein PCANC_01951 [Puccinia coronata f. sp. avenae]|uniref:Uncharacterized protein n=1 Tax=Puccinia coronata f. sp. avenae TaxID=200324 RepID=A0A2N5W4G2_9BASI|nr:hypothetical protein PCANC_17311 [Puccinia coronata f. sp. avenae]PLW51926.1 hypothetical protein PCASD_00853 [Puccinia coronata f. sp. avenae]PLW57090.1 hypothetical protein PCANC_01951 [Puccinia coronata f. sp. avenae]